MKSVHTCIPVNALSSRSGSFRLMVVSHNRQHAQLTPNTNYHVTTTLGYS